MTKQMFNETPVSASTAIVISNITFPITGIDYEKQTFEIDWNNEFINVPYQVCQFAEKKTTNGIAIKESK